MPAPSIAPGTLNLPDIWRGCDWLPITVVWKDPNGNPYDLTAWTPYAETSGGINLNPVKTDAVNGITQISLTATQTAELSLGIESWDWIWWNLPPYGFKFPPLLSGKVTIREPVTETFPFPQAPPNDNFAGAITVTGSNSDPNNPIVGTTVSATIEPGEPNPIAVNTVWYKWNGVGGIEIFYTRRDYFIDIYQGTNLGSLTLIGTSHDNGTVSAVQFNAILNTLYYIRVRPPTAIASGSFNLGWNPSPT